MQNVWFTVIYKQIYECQWTQTTEKEGTTKFLVGGPPRDMIIFTKFVPTNYKGVENDSIMGHTLNWVNFSKNPRGAFSSFLQFY